MKDEKPTHLDLFSGIGGFALAAQWAGFRTIGYCELDPYCRKVLAKNFLGNTTQREDWRLQQSEFSTDAGTGSPIFSDIFDLDGTAFRGVSLITGGFPCQPFSVAGKRRGAADDRAIWPEMFRVISEARPAWVLGENVPGIIPMELDNVLSDLEGIGYTTRSFVVPACAVDARHRRDRVWIVCNATSKGLQNGQRLSVGGRGELQQELERPSLQVSDTDKINVQRSYYHSTENGREQGQRQIGLQDCVDRGTAIWLPEPDVGRVVARLSPRLDGDRLNEASDGTREILRHLQSTFHPKEIQWPIRGLGRIQTQEVLLAELCEYTGTPKPLGNVSLESKETSQVIVRGVWFDGISACTSCRRRSEEQRRNEHPNTVRLLSQLLACDCRSTWLDATGTPTQNRVDRLKGLGNAIVPQVAFEILREIRRLI